MSDKAWWYIQIIISVAGFVGVIWWTHHERTQCDAKGGVLVRQVWIFDACMESKK